MTVPLDYSDPGGRTITVAISRIRATDTDRRVGPLLLNGGGPGGAVARRPAVGAQGDEGRRRTLRRGGRRPPIHRPQHTAELPLADRLGVARAGADRAGFDRMTAFAKDLAERCRGNAGDVLPHATTRNTARDMDVVRAALGERRISYLGYSYGSYLGEVYTTMFPGRTDRVVLDGVIDPDRYGPRLLRASSGPTGTRWRVGVLGRRARGGPTGWAGHGARCWPPWTASGRPLPVHPCGSATTGWTST
ncbi:hypothetical protein GCM10011428_28780 [Streptomyces violaceus]|uniref:hypothetical protein n=1 Tax=Streptomyces violaceus TaxID=1936 RepID=UPI00338041B5